MLICPGIPRSWNSASPSWRKNQTRSVSVVNLVAEGSIEHGILHLLGQKEALADGVLDGAGDLAARKMPSGRGAFIERMQAMMDLPARGAPRVISAELHLVRRLEEGALMVEECRGHDGHARLLVVLDADAETLAAEAARAAGDAAVAAEIVGLDTWRSMRRSAATGLLKFTHEARELIHRLHCPRNRPPPRPPVSAERNRSPRLTARCAWRRCWPMAASRRRPRLFSPVATRDDGGADRARRSARRRAKSCQR